MARHQWIIVLLASVCLVRCGPYTPPITASSVQFIDACLTTKRALLAKFGPPAKKSQSAVGYEYLWQDEDENRLYVIFQGDFVVDWVRNPIGTYVAQSRCEKKK